MNRLTNIIFASILFLLIHAACHPNDTTTKIIDLNGSHQADTSKIWLSHEHILVDFIGADSIDPQSWNLDSIGDLMLPYLEALTQHEVDYFVDATPMYLGRNVQLLTRLSERSGLKILTNTGLYGARNNQFIPSFAFESTAEELADIWTEEFNKGIDGTPIRPGFIKIGVDNQDPLDPLHKKIVKAAALTHLQTGLTIASHTGAAQGMWPQISILEQLGVSPSAFIWVHAQNEKAPEQYKLAAQKGIWISLDGLGWEINLHVEKIIFAKENGFLDRILISHDAGWFDPQKKEQRIQPYTALFEEVIPKLTQRGFTREDIHTLIQYNPARAFAIEIRKK